MMSSPSSLADLPIRRITKLFPFPVQGHDITDVLNETSIDLGRIGLFFSSDQWVELDLGDAHEPPLLHVYEAQDGGRWISLYYTDHRLAVVSLPLKAVAYEADDEVYDLKFDPSRIHRRGRVTRRSDRCVSVVWEGMSNVLTYGIEEVALFNDYTRRERGLMKP